MPQMAPINWLSLFFIFSLTLIMFNLLNYFSLTLNSNKKYFYNKSFNKFMNWKW